MDDLWEGFSGGVRKSLEEGKNIVRDGAANGAGKLANYLGIPDDGDKPDPPDSTFDWVLYGSAGVALLALAVVVIFKFR